jgi:hypothetical protein
MSIAPWQGRRNPEQRLIAGGQALRIPCATPTTPPALTISLTPLSYQARGSL